MDVKEEVNVASGAIVQLPIELSPAMRRRLAQWCSETASLLDVPAVAGTDIIEALIDQLVDDAHTSDAVRRRLVDSGAYRAPAPPAPAAPAAAGPTSAAPAPTRAGDGDRISLALVQRLNQCPRITPAAAATRIDHYLRAMDRAARPATVDGVAPVRARGV